MHTRDRAKRLLPTVRRLFSTLVLLLAFSGVGFTATDTEDAADAAEQFLQQLDHGAYGDAWEDAAQLFKRQTNKNMWRDNIGHLRPNYGTLLKRSLQFIKPLKQIAGAPQGSYMLLIFGSNFSTRGQAAETVTLMLEEDRTWRVLGYSIE